MRCLRRTRLHPLLRASTRLAAGAHSGQEITCRLRSGKKKEPMSKVYMRTGAAASPRRRSRRSNVTYAQVRSPILMVVKLSCCVLSIASFTMCFFPHDMDERVWGVSKRCVMLCATSVPMLQHLYDFVFDEAFLRHVDDDRPWMTLPILSFACSPHPASLCVIALLSSRADTQASTALAVCLACWLDGEGMMLVAAWMVDRLLARYRSPVAAMCARQLLESYFFFTITALSGNRADSDFFLQGEVA